jgi:hypothetical protein
VRERDDGLGESVEVQHLSEGSQEGVMAMFPVFEQVGCRWEFRGWREGLACGCRMIACFDSGGNLWQSWMI